MGRFSLFAAAARVYERRRVALRQRLLEPVLVRRRAFRETVLTALSRRGHLVYCELPEGKFFVDPADRVIGGHLIWRGAWQTREVDRAVEILRAQGRDTASTVFVEAGANIGTQTIHALNRGYFARALAFEPEPGNLRLLRMNLAANGLAGRASAVGLAAGAQAGRAMLHVHSRNKGAHTTELDPAFDGEKQEVETVRLDAALADAGVAASDVGLVWIDVEGAEPDVVEGLGELIGRVPLALEYSATRYAPAARERLDALLAKNYSRLYRLDRDGAKPEPASELASLKAMTDILLV